MGELTDDQVRALLKGATPGPWEYGHLGNDVLWIGPSYHKTPVAHVDHDMEYAQENSRENAAAIATWPDLARMYLDRSAELDAQGALLAADRKAHEKEIAVWSENYAALEAELAASRAREAVWHNGSRPIPFDRDTVGRMVREAWVRWAETQPSPKPSWLVPYEELNEADKEADRQIGEAVARWTLAFDAARAALALAKTEPPDDGWTWNEGLHKWLPPMGEAG